MLGRGACVLIRVKSPIPGMSSNRHSLAAISRAGKTYFSKVFCGFQGLGSAGSKEAISRTNGRRVIVGKASSPDFMFSQLGSGEDYWFFLQAAKEEKGEKYFVLFFLPFTCSLLLEQEFFQICKTQD